VDVHCWKRFIDIFSLGGEPMTRWNISQIAFYGLDHRKRTIDLKLDEVSILTGRSGTGKSAIIACIDYCLGSKSCELPDYVRRRTIGVAVHWKKDGVDLIVGREVPDSGIGTDKMFGQLGRSLSLPESFNELGGPAPRASVRKVLERAFGIADLEDFDAEEKSTVGKASIRHVTPYLFLTADVIISNKTLLHDLNDPDKARDIRATMPYFLQAIDQKTVLNQRKLRRLEITLAKAERVSRSREKSRSLFSDRAGALIAQSANLGMTVQRGPDIGEQQLLNTLREISLFDVRKPSDAADDELSKLEKERKSFIRLASETREHRNALRELVRESSGFETTVSSQFEKLNLVRHLNLDTELCPVCQQASGIGHQMSKEMAHSLSLIESEVAAVRQVGPELLEQLERSENELMTLNENVREVEGKIRKVIQQNESLQHADDLAQARSMQLGRVVQFLETTVEDFEQTEVDLENLQDEIDYLRDLVDPQAIRDRIAFAENMVSNYATEMLQKLPSTAPLTDARLQFFSDGRLRIIESQRQRSLSLVEVGSDQNYLAIHLALLFALHKHFEDVVAPVPGLLVIDQISRPYYPKDQNADDEKSLQDISKDDDRRSMRQIIDFIFKQTEMSSGLQILLIEHAYIEQDPRYRNATTERWTRDNGLKLIPEDWAERA
tara:strand:- start:61022 stop:63022 length:2001 start_codon:yes stop_codon:yes gene_type:complete